MAKKQADLPTMEDRGIRELDMVAGALKETRAQRMELLKEEIKMADGLVALMHKHGRMTYSYDGYEVEIVPGKGKVKVRSVDGDKSEDDGKGE